MWTGGQPLCHFAPNQHYIIYAVHSDNLKSLDIAQDKVNFGQLILYSFHGAPNQRFVFEQQNHMYRIKSVSENKYINVTRDSDADNMWLRVDDLAGKKSELWSVEPANEPKYGGKKAYRIRSAFSKYLETPKNSLDNNVHIQQNTFNGGDGQTWVIREI